MKSMTLFTGFFLLLFQFSKAQTLSNFPYPNMSGTERWEKDTRDHKITNSQSPAMVDNDIAITTATPIAPNKNLFETYSNHSSAGHGFINNTDLGFLAPANDNYANAIDITTQINAACATGGNYTNIAATPDQSKGSCWSGGPYNNVWFKFTASSSGTRPYRLSYNVRTNRVMATELPVFQ